MTKSTSSPVLKLSKIKATILFLNAKEISAKLNLKLLNWMKENI